ncbi:hypothetical protein DL546_004315 [Coniochaeta pulveracea]|uniref:Uncharacterized protein n=1 Tax=Coniochaeta pulveracea TaxID=177199 RepID=A0A420Y2T3_9PEZI|nr:hypothetical protein DL546_004315 [Coniochaeta pulveracea]
MAQDNEVTALGQAIDFYRSTGVDELSEPINDEMLYRRKVASIYYYRCLSLETLLKRRRTLDSSIDDLEVERRLFDGAIYEKEDELGYEVPDSKEERTNNAYKADSISSIKLGEAAYKPDSDSDEELSDEAD